MALTVVPRDSGNAHRKPAFDSTHLPRRDGTLIGPELPETREWSQQTRDWYDMWRRHEMAPFLEPSDWSHIHDTAVLYDAFWTGELPGSSMIAGSAEIRRRCASFGATVEDRLKLRIKFVEKEPEKTNTPASRVDYFYLEDEL